MAHGVVRLDKVRSVKSGHIFSVIDRVNDIDNGMLVKLGAPIDRELYEAETGEDGDRFLLITTPETHYDEDSKYTLIDFVNKAGTPARAHDVEPQDIFAVSSILITPINATEGVQEGNYLVNDGRKYKEVAAANDSNGFVAKIIDVETIGGLIPYAGSESANTSYKLVAMHVIKNGNYKN